ncbi:MAG: DNA recombination protein RmuC [Syntrophaceae bacterium]
MLYAYIAAAFLAGCLLGWLLARPKLAELSARASAADGVTADLKARAAALDDQVSALRAEIEQERLENARGQIRLEEAQAALGAQKELLDEARVRLSDSFGALSADALKQNNQLFLELASKTLEGVIEKSKGELGKRQEAIDGLIRPLQDTLTRYETQIREMENTRQSAYGGLKTYLEELAKTNLQLQEQTRSLSTALKRPQVKGRWGEVTLRRVVEIAGMSPHCDFTEQPSMPTEEGRRRPDLVVSLPDNRTIAVDSKVPLDAYMDAFATSDEDARTGLLKKHAQVVRGHMQMLGSKDYWKQLPQSPDFVVLFLPGESFFSAALEIDRTLIEDGMEHRVILATPTTLIALLRTVALSWQQQQVAENAQQIWQEGSQLFDRLKVFADHMKNVRAGLQKATESYNKMLSSWESRVMPSATRLKDLGGPQHERDLPEIEHIDPYLREPHD